MSASAGQDKANSGVEYDKMINELRRATDSPHDIILPTPLGPITVEDLANIQDGWKYETFTTGYPGAQVAITPANSPYTIYEINDRRGWLMNASIIFTSPYGRFDVTVDNWTNGFSPILAEQLVGVLPTNQTPYHIVYNPATMLGPQYGITFDPNIPRPFNRFLKLSASLYPQSPVSTINLFAADVARIEITDYPTFIKAVKRFMIEQMIGKKVDRFL